MGSNNVIWRLLCLVLTTLCVSLGAGAQEAPDGGVDVVILGDSNTWLGKDDCTGERGWNRWFAEWFAPASCRSYARSGATWSNTRRTRRNTEENIGVLGDDNVAYNQICRLKEACAEGRQAVPDLIIVALGTNDAWFEDKRPDVFDMTVDEAFGCSDGFVTNLSADSVLSLALSVRYGCEMLMEAFPDARLVLLTPLQSTAVSDERIRLAGDIIEECGARMSVQVVRLDKESGIYSVRERVGRKYTYDGTHTSVEGAQIVAKLVVNRIKGR